MVSLNLRRQKWEFGEIKADGIYRIKYQRKGNYKERDSNLPGDPLELLVA